MIDFRLFFDVFMVDVLMFILLNGFDYVEYNVIKVVVRWFDLG